MDIQKRGRSSQRGLAAALRAGRFDSVAAGLERKAKLTLPQRYAMGHVCYQRGDLKGTLVQWWPLVGGKLGRSFDADYAEVATAYFCFEAWDKDDFVESTSLEELSCLYQAARAFLPGQKATWQLRVQLCERLWAADDFMALDALLSSKFEPFNATQYMNLAAVRLRTFQHQPVLAFLYIGCFLTGAATFAAQRARNGECSEALDALAEELKIWLATIPNVRFNPPKYLRSLEDLIDREVAIIKGIVKRWRLSELPSGTVPVPSYISCLDPLSEERKKVLAWLKGLAPEDQWLRRFYIDHSQLTLCYGVIEGRGVLRYMRRSIWTGWPAVDRFMLGMQAVRFEDSRAVEVIRSVRSEAMAIAAQINRECGRLMEEVRSEQAEQLFFAAAMTLPAEVWDARMRAEVARRCLDGVHSSRHDGAKHAAYLSTASKLIDDPALKQEVLGFIQRRQEVVAVLDGLTTAKGRKAWLKTAREPLCKDDMLTTLRILGDAVALTCLWHPYWKVPKSADPLSSLVTFYKLVAEVVNGARDNDYLPLEEVFTEPLACPCIPCAKKLMLELLPRVQRHFAIPSLGLPTGKDIALPPAAPRPKRVSVMLSVNPFAALGVHQDGELGVKLAPLTDDLMKDPEAMALRYEAEEQMFAPGRRMTHEFLRYFQHERYPVFREAPFFDKSQLRKVMPLHGSWVEGSE